MPGSYEYRVKPMDLFIDIETRPPQGEYWNAWQKTLDMPRNAQEEYDAALDHWETNDVDKPKKSRKLPATYQKEIDAVLKEASSKATHPVTAVIWHVGILAGGDYLRYDEYESWTAESPDGMSPRQLIEIADKLLTGDRIFAWNGRSFDFPALRLAFCRAHLLLDIFRPGGKPWESRFIDPMADLSRTSKGYGLQAVAQSLGLEGPPSCEDWGEVFKELDYAYRQGLIVKSPAGTIYSTPEAEKVIAKCEADCRQLREVVKMLGY